MQSSRQSERDTLKRRKRNRTVYAGGSSDETGSKNVLG